MLSFTVLKGSLNPPEVVALIERAENGGYGEAAGQFDDAPTLACTVWPGDDRAAVGALGVSWHDAAAAMVLIEFTQATIDALETGRYRVEVKVASTGLLVAEFTLKVEAGPGSRAARPVYCTYQDLTDELSWIGDLADETEDQSGFAEIRAKARDWTDGEIMRRLRGRCDVAEYVAAMAVGGSGVDLTTPDGRRIVQANVCYSIAKILSRGISKREGLDDRAAAYMEEAKTLLFGTQVGFVGGSPPPVVLGMVFGRASR